MAIQIINSNPETSLRMISELDKLAFQAYEQGDYVSAFFYLKEEQKYVGGVQK